MYNRSQFILSLMLFCVMYNYQCLKVIPERAELTYKNESYLEDDLILNVRRYSRKGDYVVNLVFTVKATLNNNVLVDVIFYEYLHNEYRRSFVEMHFKLCDLIKKDPYIGDTLRKSGLNTCPLYPGKFCISNMTFNQVFPSVWPFEKGQAEFIFKFSKTGAMVAKAIVVLTFKQDLRKIVL